MKQIALLALLLLAGVLGCAGLDNTQRTLQALDGKWVIDSTMEGQEELAGMYMEFKIKENRATLGLEQEEQERFDLAYKPGKAKEGFLVLDMWPLKNPGDIKTLQFQVDKNRMTMSETDSPEEAFVFIRQ